MTLRSVKYLEDYQERFQLNYRWANCNIDAESLKLFLLRGNREYVIETLNMLYGKYIYQLPYDDIKTVFKNYSRVVRKKGKSSQNLVSSSPSTTSIEREIGNMLEDFKSEMLHTFSMQMDTLQIKMKLEEVKRALAIFCPRCTKRHPSNECPLNVIEFFLVCEENHATKKCPSLLDLKVVYQEGV